MYCTFCRKGALSSVRYSLRAEVYFRKFSNFSTKYLCILATYIGQYVCDPGLSWVGFGIFEPRGIQGNNKMSQGKKGAVKKINIVIWHHHISTLFSSTLLVRSLATPSDSGPQQCRVQSLNLCVKMN